MNIFAGEGKKSEILVCGGGEGESVEEGSAEGRSGGGVVRLRGGPAEGGPAKSRTHPRRS